MASIEISPLLEWAWAILQTAFDYVWICCLLVFLFIIMAGTSDKIAIIINKIIKRMKSRKGTKRQRG